MYICDFITFLSTATLPSGKCRYRLFLEKVTSLLRSLKSQLQKDISSVNNSNVKNPCIGNLESEIYKQKKHMFAYI
jgi:hypothetical protein